MMPMGYEYGFDRPLDVVMTRPDHWQTPRFDITSFITEVNAMKASVPALNEEGSERVLGTRGDAIGLLRNAEAGSSSAVALINPGTVGDATVDALDVLSELREAVDITPQAAPRATVAPGAQIVLRPLEMRVFTNGFTGAGRDGAAADGVAQRAESSPDLRASARPAVIEAVWPQIDGGRHPVKRIVGDRFEVQADIFREGHDAIAAVLKYRERGALAWRETPMELFDNDRWRGAFTLERNTRYQYTIEAWPDAFATWRHATQRKHAAGQVIELELREGRVLIDAAYARAGRAARIRLAAIVAELDELPDAGAQADVMLGDALRDVMRAVPDRSLATTYVGDLEVIADRRAAQFGAWYELFPRSQGAVPGWPRRSHRQRTLPDIRAMGFDVIYLPPIHPIGTTYRKGPQQQPRSRPRRPGQPVGDRQRERRPHGGRARFGHARRFRALRRRRERAGIEIALDFALQCSPDHPYVTRASRMVRISARRHD